MTKTDAMCYARHGIRVNAVHPGSTKTPLFLKAGETYPGGLDVYLDMMKQKHPLTLGEPIGRRQLRAVPRVRRGPLRHRRQPGRATADTPRSESVS